MLGEINKVAANTVEAGQQRLVKNRCNFNELLFNYAYKYGPEGGDGEDKILYFFFAVLGQVEIFYN